jgi:hypothetical protein
MSHHQSFSQIAFPWNHVFSYPPLLLWAGLVFLCLFPANAQAGEVTLAWDPPSTEYGGFILAYGTSSGSYTHTQDVGTQATYTVTSLTPGQTYYFAVKAYSPARDVESPFSNQVSATLPTGGGGVAPVDNTPPATPRNVRVH